MEREQSEISGYPVGPAEFIHKGDEGISMDAIVSKEIADLLQRKKFGPHTERSWGKIDRVIRDERIEINLKEIFQSNLDEVISCGWVERVDYIMEKADQHKIELSIKPELLQKGLITIIKKGLDLENILSFAKKYNIDLNLYIPRELAPRYP